MSRVRIDAVKRDTGHRNKPAVFRQPVPTKRTEKREEDDWDDGWHSMDPGQFRENVESNRAREAKKARDLIVKSAEAEANAAERARLVLHRLEETVNGRKSAENGHIDNKKSDPLSEVHNNLVEAHFEPMRACLGRM